MDGCSDAVIFWTKDESDADINNTSQQRGAHVPGVTDTAMDLKKKPYFSRRQDVLQNTQKGHRRAQPRTQATDNHLHVGKRGEKTSKQDERRSSSKEGLSLKDLRVEDKIRVANLVRELAKAGEEKEIAVQQLQVERKENEMKTSELQSQLIAILKERENIQQQFLECQKLLSSYQTKLSENQEQLSYSLHDRTSHTPHRKSASDTRWSSVKESRRVSPLTHHSPADTQQNFVQLQPVHDDSHEPRRTASTMVCKERHDSSLHEQQDNGSARRASPDQFNPVLSSTHRSHHQSRVPQKHDIQGNKAAETQGLTNGMSSSKPQRMYELSPAVASVKSNGHEEPQNHSHVKQSSREGSSRRTSSDTFLPLPEVTDYTRSTSGPGETVPTQRSSQEMPQTNAWTSLPEMNGKLPTTAESQMNTSLQLENPQNGIGGKYASNKGREDLREHQLCTPQQRHEELGFVRDRLQQEQQWLQHKLQEQEQLLREKQLEIQVQKFHLNQQSLRQIPENDMTSTENHRYEKVKRAYLRRGTHETHRTDGMDAPAYSRGAPHFIGPHEMMPVDPSSRRQHPAASSEWSAIRQVSTVFPPGGFEQLRQRAGYWAPRMQDHGSRDPVQRQRDEEYLAISDDDDDEEDGDRAEERDAWYEMREVTEGADNYDTVQGYTSLHPPGNRRQGVGEVPASSDMAASPAHQSYHVSDIATPSLGAASRYKSASRYHERQTQQLGNMTAILEAEQQHYEAPPEGIGNYNHLRLRGQQTSPIPSHEVRGDARVPFADRTAHISHAPPAGGLSHPGVADFVPQQGGRGGAPYPRTAESVPHAMATGYRVSHSRLAGRTLHPANSAGVPPYPEDQNYPHPHHISTGRHPASMMQAGGSNPKGGGHKGVRSGEGHIPHSGNGGVPGGYRSQRPSHGRQTEGASHQAAAPTGGAGSQQLVERSSQVIRDIGLLLEEREEIGEEEESRVLGDVFFLQ